MSRPTELRTQLAVIGAGMTGSCAGLFACRRGLATAVLGGAGELAYAAGPWDLLGVHPIEERKDIVDPWLGIEALVGDHPDHPYARLSEMNLRAAFAVLLEAFRDARYPYERLPDVNCAVITSIGTIKRTFCLPHTMWAGAQALQEREPCRIVEFHGMRDFSARQIVATLSKSWRGLEAVRVPFPGTEHLPEVSNEYLARCMDLKPTRRRLAEVLLPLVETAESVGFPAMLGHDRTLEVLSDLQNWLGVPVFEIPSGPVSVPGIRMRNAFLRLLGERRAQLLVGQHVHGVDVSDDGFVLHAAPFDRQGQSEYRIVADAVMLATGRFVGGGLDGDRQQLRETVFDLPVDQPEQRAHWHRAQLLDPQGHAINRAGVNVDDAFRALARDGSPAHERLFAAGSILAHQDWMRSKCGSGLAIGTAYAAVDSCVAQLRRARPEAK